MFRIGHAVNFGTGFDMTVNDYGIRFEAKQGISSNYPVAMSIILYFASLVSQQSYENML